MTKKWRKNLKKCVLYAMDDSVWQLFIVYEYVWMVKSCTIPTGTTIWRNVTTQKWVVFSMLCGEGALIRIGCSYSAAEELGCYPFTFRFSSGDSSWRANIAGRGVLYAIAQRYMGNRGGCSLREKLCGKITIDSDHEKRSICERCTLFLHSPFHRMVALTLINMQNAYIMVL